MLAYSHTMILCLFRFVKAFFLFNGGSKLTVFLSASVHLMGYVLFPSSSPNSVPSSVPSRYSLKLCVLVHFKQSSNEATSASGSRFRALEVPNNFLNAVMKKRKRK